MRKSKLYGLFGPRSILDAKHLPSFSQEINFVFPLCFEDLFRAFITKDQTLLSLTHQAINDRIKHQLTQLLNTVQSRCPKANIVIIYKIPVPGSTTLKTHQFIKHLATGDEPSLSFVTSTLQLADLVSIEALNEGLANRIIIQSWSDFLCQHQPELLQYQFAPEETFRIMFKESLTKIESLPTEQIRSILDYLIQQKNAMAAPLSGKAIILNRDFCRLVIPARHASTMIEALQYLYHAKVHAKKVIYERFDSFKKLIDLCNASANAHQQHDDITHSQQCLHVSFNIQPSHIFGIELLSCSLSFGDSDPTPIVINEILRSQLIQYIASMLLMPSFHGTLRSNDTSVTMILPSPIHHTFFNMDHLDHTNRYDHEDIKQQLVNAYLRKICIPHVLEEAAFNDLVAAVYRNQYNKACIISTHPPFEWASNTTTYQYIQTPRTHPKKASKRKKRDHRKMSPPIDITSNDTNTVFVKCNDCLSQLEQKFSSSPEEVKKIQLLRRSLKQFEKQHGYEESKATIAPASTPENNGRFKQNHH